MFVHINLIHQPCLYTSLMVSNQEMVSQDSVEINKLGTLHIKNGCKVMSEIMKILQERHTRSKIMKNLICLTFINIFFKIQCHLVGCLSVLKQHIFTWKYDIWHDIVCYALSEYVNSILILCQFQDIFQFHYFHLHKLCFENDMLLSTLTFIIPSTNWTLFRQLK